MSNDLKSKEFRHINYLLTDGGMGDLIAALPVIKYIDSTYRHVRQHVWVPDYAVDFVRLCFPDIRVGSFTEAKDKYDGKKANKNTRWDGRLSPMKIHLVDYAFLVLTDELPEAKHKNYVKPNLSEVNIDKFELPKKYVVIAPGYTAENRQFLPKTVNEVSDYCKSQGYEVVFLGKTESPTGEKHVIIGKFAAYIEYSKGINLINKTTLIEASTIIAGAACMIGLDNGLLHVAGCTDVPIIGGFTNVDPSTRMPYRNDILGYNFHYVVPDESLRCRFCQTKMNFVYGHDFKTCYYKNYKCLYELTTKKWISAIGGILGNQKS